MGIAQNVNLFINSAYNLHLIILSLNRHWRTMILNE